MRRDGFWQGFCWGAQAAFLLASVAILWGKGYIRWPW